MTAHRITDAEADALAQWFSDTLGAAPATFGPMRRQLPTREEATATAAKHAAIGAVWRGTEPDCAACGDTGWVEYEPGDSTRCNCREGWGGGPESAFLDLDLATQERLTKRQQTGMAGE